MKSILLIPAVIVLGCGGAVSQLANHVVNHLPDAGVNDCVVLGTYDEEQTRAYITSQGNAPKDPTCFAAALKRTGLYHSEETISTLIRLLDYKFPTPTGVVITAHLTPEYGEYPAVQALSAIGRAASPQLQSAIVDQGRSEAVRVNGIIALQLIYQYRAPRTFAFMKRVRQYTERAIEVPGVRGSLVADLAALDEEEVRSMKASGNTHTDEDHRVLTPYAPEQPKTADPR